MSGSAADFEDVLFVLVAVDATCKSEDGTGLACTWRAIEEKMRNAILLYKLFDWATQYVVSRYRVALEIDREITCRGDVLVRYDVVQRYRSVLFDPLQVK